MTVILYRNDSGSCLSTSCSSRDTVSVVQSDKSHKSASDQEWDYGRLWKQGQRGVPLCTFIVTVKV